MDMPREQMKHSKMLVDIQTRAAKELVEMQIVAQEKIAREQVDVARSTRNAAIAAAVAAFLSVVATLLQAWPVLKSIIDRQ